MFVLLKRHMLMVQQSVRIPQRPRSAWCLAPIAGAQVPRERRDGGYWQQPPTTRSKRRSTQRRTSCAQRAHLLRQPHRLMCSITCGCSSTEPVRARLDLGSAESAPLRVRRRVVFDFSGKGSSAGSRWIALRRGPAAHEKVFARYAGRANPGPLAPISALRSTSRGTSDSAYAAPAWALGCAFTSSAVVPAHGRVRRLHGWNTLPFLGAGSSIWNSAISTSVHVPPDSRSRRQAARQPTAIRTPQERLRLAGCIHVSRDKSCRHHAAGRRSPSAARPVPGTRTWRFNREQRPRFRLGRGRACAGTEHVDGILIRRSIIPTPRRGKKANTCCVRAQHFSGALGQYPWPQISAVGLGSREWSTDGESTVPRFRSAKTSYWVLMHELGHQVFRCRSARDEAARIRG